MARDLLPTKNLLIFKYKVSAVSAVYHKICPLDTSSSVLYEPKSKSQAMCLSHDSPTEPSTADALCIEYCMC